MSAPLTPREEATASSGIQASEKVRQAGRLGLADVVDGLVACGHIDAEDAAKFKHERRFYRGDIHPVLVIAQQHWKSKQLPHRVLDQNALTEWLASWAKMDFYPIDPVKINFSAVTEVMSSAYAARFRILPVEVKPQEVVIATCEPFDRRWESELRGMLRKDIRVVLSCPDDISRYQVEFYNLAKSVRGAMARGDVANAGLSNFEQLVELGKGKTALDANDRHVVMIVDWLWQYAFELRASDIHVEPRREIGIVRFRIDGVLHQVYQIPMPVLNAMTSRIKILGRMDVVEKRRPQDGRIKTRMPDGQEVELRLSTLPTAFGEKLVMRIFDPNVLQCNFAELGFGEEERVAWQKMTAQPNGIILVTGPTGSGKTTTLYATLKQLATPEVNVCTLEDPIEMVEPNFNQMQIQHDLSVNFAEGIRALMRQDPDIIMVGEIRDLETAEMAIQAALTGHLVLSTLHTNDAAAAITRLLDLGVPAYQIHATIVGVMAQRLIRTLCPKCKSAQPLDGAEEIEMWNTLVKPWNIKPPTQTYHPVGCLDCRNTGYQGRIGLYEILPMSLEIKKVVTAQTDLDALRNAAYRGGMYPMRIAGAMKIYGGTTSLDEVLRAVPIH
jgi:general secretion pathway protein E